MRILKNLLVTLAAIIGVLLVVSLFLPAQIHVERATVVSAAPSEVFSLVNDFRQFNRWSPWAEIDPATEYTYSGPAAGVGARMAWVSDHPNVGSGSQEIVASEPYDRVEVKLEFGPDVAHAYYALSPVSGGTNVVWAFDADFGYNPIGRYMGLMLDKWIGADYERGLANLKRVIEEES